MAGSRIPDIAPTPLPPLLAEVVDEAIGRGHRHDPVVGRTGGPAGNARLTAWAGMLLLGLTVIELVTVLDVQGLISWHIVVGTLLVPLALLKSGSTTWRIIRYYAGNEAYRSAGPPPMLLRLLGPLVVVTTLGLLGTGLALIALGQDAGRRPFLSILGLQLDTLSLHQALFLAFAVAAGLHLLARFIPALRLVTGKVADTVPARRARLAVMALTAIVAIITAVLVLGWSGAWRTGDRHHGHDDGLRSHISVVNLNRS
ncbi:MAG: hypothetical protein ABI345_03945 [Jatrophihabitans sp.]